MNSVRTTAGPESPIEEVLAEYDLGANSWVADVGMSDTDRLILALILETRGVPSLSEFRINQEAGQPGEEDNLGPGSFSRVESPEPVTVAAGDTETLLDAEFAGRWVATGATDHPESRYQYYLDGDPFLPNRIRAPLGLPKDLLRFPDPIPVEREVRIEVTRTEAASGSADYIGTIDAHR